MVECTGRGLVVKRPGVLSKVQMLNLVLGVGVFSLLPRQCFQELVSEKLLSLLRDRPHLELIIVSSNFQALLLLQDKLLESV